MKIQPVWTTRFTMWYQHQMALEHIQRLFLCETDVSTRECTPSISAHGCLTIRLKRYIPFRWQFLSMFHSQCVCAQPCLFFCCYLQKIILFVLRFEFVTAGEISYMHEGRTGRSGDNSVVTSLTENTTRNRSYSRKKILLLMNKVRTRWEEKRERASN